MTTRRRQPNRGNKKSISEEEDIILISHLLSRDSFQGLSFLIEKGTLLPNSPKYKQKLKNRLGYLRVLRRDFPRDFNEIASSYGIPKQYTPTQLQVKSSTPKMPTFTYNNKQSNNNDHDVGNIIVTKTKRGIFMVMVWVDSILDDNILEIFVDESGRKVIKRRKKPSARVKASDLLQQMGYSYGWACDEDNAIVTELQAELDRIQAQREDNRDDGWEEDILCELDEEVVKAFVDHRGVINNNIDFIADGCGRQRICFFLKTVRSTSKASPARFTSSDFGKADSTMDEDETGETAMDESLDDVRNEFNDKMSQLNEMMQQMHQLMMQQGGNQQPPGTSQSAAAGQPALM